MHPYSELPPPLTTHEFYILLALSRGDLHVYAIKAVVHSDSLGSVTILPGRLYPAITRLHDEGLIDLVGEAATDNSGKKRKHYATSKHGILRLKEELARLDHAVKIGQNAGLMNDTVPADIQRLLLKSAAASRYADNHP